MRELLFTVHKDKLEQSVVKKLLKTHVQSLFMHRPPYYLLPFRCPSYSEHEIARKVIKLGALPNSLEINMKCVSKQIYTESETNNQLLSSLRRVRVYCSWNDKELHNVLKHIVGYTGKSDHVAVKRIRMHSNLQSLELLNCTSHNVRSITPLLSSSRGYNHLKCLHISMQSPNSTMRHLPGIIKHQINTLEELKLTNFELSPNAGIYSRYVRL